MVWDDTPQPVMPLTVVSGPVANGEMAAVILDCGETEEDVDRAGVLEGSIFADEEVVAACAGAVVAAGCKLLACAIPAA